MKPASPQTVRNTQPCFQMNVLRLLAAMLLFVAPSLRAQENLIGTVGLAHTDQSGRNWAYITWQGNDGAGIANEAFAVYGKPGDASSVSNYTRLSIIARQQDTLVIQSLLQRSVNLGDNLILLDADLVKLFGDVIPAGTVSLSEKLSAVLRGTTGNDRGFRNLALLARIHPGVALNLGIAVAEQFPAGVSNMTFEVRRWNLATMSDRAVVGRVTVQAGARLMLPAPGAAVELPDVTGSGNLNVKMRWAVPDTLRRLALATHGFNVWRVNKTYAEAAGWNVTPPSSDQLQGGFVTSPLAVRRINTVPVLAAKYFAPTNVADFGTNGDASTFFFTDNNDVFKGGQAFVDGAGYYYFITARDLLGRDGTPSPGTLMKACDRIPPQPPRNLKVRSLHEYLPGNSLDGLLLSWDPPIGGGPVLAYHVYRYGSLAELKANSANVVSNHIAGPLTFPPNTDPLRYIDRPCTNSFLASSNTTFWYVVRATETTACGTNVSNPSGPGFGSCRAWNGPGAINGVFYTTCLVPSVTCFTNGLAVNPNPNPNCCPYRLICYRESSAIEWAEFVYQQNGVLVTNRVYFTSKGNSATIDICLPGGQAQQIRCCVGTSGGSIACAGPCVQVDCNPQQINIITFKAKVSTTVVAQSKGDTNGDCATHFHRLPYSDPVTGRPGLGTNGIDISLSLPPGTKEYRVYRSVDGGPRSLMAAGTNTPTGVTVSDTALPINSSIICYYSQALDVNGNPGPLTLLEPCVPVAGSIPAPQQSPISGTSLTIFGSQMNLSWFCPTPGIDHFEVLLSEDAVVTSSQLTPVPSIPPVLVGGGMFGFRVAAAAPSDTAGYKVYRTPRVGALFGTNDLFNVSVSTEAGKTVAALVRAVDIHGNRGPLSNEEDFTGALEKTLLLPQVAWPARALPLPGTNTYNPELKLREIADDNCFEGVGIVVGQTSIEQFYTCTDIQVNKSDTFTSTDQLGRSIFPFVVYRHQVTNPRYPIVSGDVLQVTPLIEKVYLEEESPPSIYYLRLRDPFTTLRPSGKLGLSDLMIRDTQPVVRGARYRYTLVRFKANHEIEEIVPAGEIEVSE